MPGWEVEQGRDVESLVRELLLLVSLLDQCELREARYHTLVHNAGRQLLAEYEKHWHLGQKIRRIARQGCSLPEQASKTRSREASKSCCKFSGANIFGPRRQGVSPGAQSDS